MSMKKSSDAIGNRTRDLPACSAVPQPTAPPRAPGGGRGWYSEAEMLSYSAALKFQVKSYLTQTHDRVLKPEMRNTASFLDRGNIHVKWVARIGWSRPTLLPGSSDV